MDFKAAVGNFSASLAPYIKLLQNCNEANNIHCKNNALGGLSDCFVRICSVSTTIALEYNVMLQTGILSVWANYPAMYKTQPGKCSRRERGGVTWWILSL